MTGKGKHFAGKIMDQGETDYGESAEQRSGTIAADKLSSLVARVEELRTRKAEIADDIAVVMREVKTAGFDLPAFKVVLQRREKTPEQNQAMDALVALYLGALAGDGGRVRH
jgi:uncharacterized protein (UPF0335 family)